MIGNDGISKIGNEVKNGGMVLPKKYKGIRLSDKLKVTKKRM